MRARCLHRLLRHLVVALAAVFLIMGFCAVAPVFADDARLGFAGAGEALSALVEPMLEPPAPAAPPEFLNEALARANAAAHTPLKALTSAVLSAAVPWVFEHAWQLVAAAAGAAVLAVANALLAAREPEDLVPFE